MSGLTRAALIAAIFLGITISPAIGNAGVDWPKIKTTKMVLIYPGTTSWEFAHSDDHRLGSRGITRRKKGCRRCHLSKEGELDLKADEIAAGTLKMKRTRKPFEPDPIPGKHGTMSADIQAAYDKEYLYIRVRWNSKGTGWRQSAGKGVPDRVTFQINKKNDSFKRYGCFITCHNDVNTMPESPTKEQVKSNPYYKALGRDDVRLYAYYARQSWAKTKSAAERKKMLAAGGLIDLWSLELASGGVKARDGWIFDDRRWEKVSDVEGSGDWGGGRYTVVFKRRLRTPGPRDISIKDGDIISAGIAIHEDGAKKRQHYVSFPFTIGIGAASDLRAVKISTD
ncbi:MAG: hypothetical protein BMS9Abin23_0030 [Thermodesulfobacteriota bacterium]|nr:MAG: hypothetical protein BMS9Abin23_0030 [Thermodesulfobacteriota bacterium]